MITFAPPFNEFIVSYKPIIPIYMQNGKLSPLQRWIEGTIDFDKIVYIDDAYHTDRMGYGGHFVAISIRLIGDKSLHYEWDLSTEWETITKEEYLKNPNYPNNNIGGSYHRNVYNILDKVKKLQETVVDDLLKWWRVYKEGC